MQGAITVFLAAGYETTATTLSYVSYHLALNPDIQQKLREEIDEYFPTKVCGVGSIAHIESYCPNAELSTNVLLWQRVCQSSHAGLWTASWSDSLC